MSARNPAHRRTADARFTRHLFLCRLRVCPPDRDYFCVLLSWKPLASFCCPPRRQFNARPIRAPPHRRKAHAKFLRRLVTRRARGVRNHRRDPPRRHGPGVDGSPGSPAREG